MIKAENIYKYRSYIRNLYLKNTQLQEDLKEIENNTKIEKLDVDIKNFYIGVLLNENSDREDMSNIIFAISDKIQKFIIDNINNISVPNEEKNEFEEFISNSRLLYDMSNVGKLIKFSL